MLDRKDVETVVHSDNEFATVAYLRIKDAYLADKDEPSHPPVTAPPLLLPEFQDLETHLRELIPSSQILKPSDTGGRRVISASSCKIDGWICISNVQRVDEGPQSIGEEVASCFKILEGAQDLNNNYLLP